MLSISGLDKAAVLKVLYDAARPVGKGLFHYVPGDMTLEVASMLLEAGSRFEYVAGRVLKVDLSSDEFDPRLYDRDNGAGAAELALSKLRDGSDDTL